jgi:sugar diacid utilization regulator
VSYRLNRVKELTGFDARVPAESALLVLGLGLPEGAGA